MADNAPKTGLVLPSDDGPPALRQQVAQMEHEFAMAAPRGFEARQLVRDVQTAISANQDLLKCEARSVLGGAMTMAQLGLRVGVLGHGWLIPMWDSNYRWRDERGRERKGAFRAQLILGYLGIKELAYRSNQIAKVTSHNVHENDHFSVEYGMHEHLVHRPSQQDRGPVTGYYATVKLRGGPDVMFYYMTAEEARQYRDRYAMAKTKEGVILGPWRDEFDAMARKSCFRQLSKWVPLGTDLAVGLAVDETVRVDVTPNMDPVAVSEHPALDEAPQDQGPTAASELNPQAEVTVVPVQGPPVDPDEEWRKQAKEAQA